MNPRKIVRALLCLSVASAILLLVFLGVGMLPSRIEGVYLGLGMHCACDSVSFVQFRDGKVVLFSSNHPPANLIGRYEVGKDGSVAVFMAPFHEGESERRVFTATPRLLFTRFKNEGSESFEWYLKGIVSGTVKKTIESQEVYSAMIKRDGTVVKTFYDSALKEIRTETRQPKTAKAEQGGGSNSAPLRASP